MPSPASQASAEVASSLNIATWVPCTRSEGPGVRFALWVQGCPLRCPGCCNPEMFSDAPREQLSVDELLARILKAKQEHQIEGVTYLGGEPFSQAEALAALSKKLWEHGLSVMVFSGYTIEEIKEQGEASQALLACVDILVDGRYEQDKHTESRRWIGSTNQRVHHLTDKYPPDTEEWSKPNSIDIHFDGKELFITGFPDGPWKETLEKWQAWQKQKQHKAKNEPKK